MSNIKTFEEIHQLNEAMILSSENDFSDNRLYEGIFSSSQDEADPSINILRNLKVNPNAYAIGVNGQLKIMEAQLIERGISLAGIYEIGVIKDGQKLPGKQMNGNEVMEHIQNVKNSNGRLYVRFIESNQKKNWII